MIVWIDDEIFNGEVSSVELISFLRAAAVRRHTLLISDSLYFGWGRNYPNYFKWLHSLSLSLQKELELIRARYEIVSSNSVSYSGKVRFYISSRICLIDREICRLSLSDAIRSMSLPLHILVENQINDGRFLRSLLPPIWRERFEQWERTGELRFVQGGGNSEIARLIEYHKDDDNCRSAFGLPSKVWAMVHFVIYDHDGERIEQPGEGAKKLDRLCEKYVSHHRLARRTQESYLPIKILEIIADRRIQNPKERNDFQKKLDEFSGLGVQRYFSKLPQLGVKPFFKNEFSNLPKEWSDELVEEDDVWAEMTALAEEIASRI